MHPTVYNRSNYVHSATLQNLLLHNWSSVPFLWEILHTSIWVPFHGLLVTDYNFKKWLGYSVVPSIVNFVKVKDIPLLIVFVFSQ